MNKSAFEKLIWSIALPGFGQFLNGKVIKGIIFVALEFLINVKANFNKIILLSFNGRINDAVSETDFGWLMFYPCLYFFSMWDAVKDAGGAKDDYSFLPYVFSAFFVTVGIMYSSNLKIFGIFFGPVWLPMLLVIPGVITGLILRKVLKVIY